MFQFVVHEWRDKIRRGPFFDHFKAGRLFRFEFGWSVDGPLQPLCQTIFQDSPSRGNRVDDLFSLDGDLDALPPILRDQHGLPRPQR